MVDNLYEILFIPRATDILVNHVLNDYIVVVLNQVLEVTFSQRSLQTKVTPCIFGSLVDFRGQLWTVYEYQRPSHFLKCIKRKFFVQNFENYPEHFLNLNVRCGYD